MIYLEIPGDEMRRLPFYLATEEYAARNHAPRTGGQDIFFMWQVRPTVIFGRNQTIDNEVNLDYCRREGIEVYRRKSGGGCVFANPDNIMFSCITRTDDVATTFTRYTSTVAAMLRSLGLDATSSTRNDILIGGRKVSGNAFYNIPGHSIVHGTMLFDTDRSRMEAAITPSAAKLRAKGVQSVRSRITTIREHLPSLGIEQFKDYVRNYLCDSSLVLTADDLAAISAIEQPYYDESWIRRQRRRTDRPTRRIDGVGEFQVSVDRDATNRITGLDLAGDFFLLGDMDRLLADRLRGVKYDPEDVVRALDGVSAGNVIHDLTNQQLIELLF